MRNEDPLTEQLRRWGNAQVNRYAFTHAERGVHVLQHAREMAPGTKENAMRDLVARDGAQRRRFMGERSGVQGMQTLPMWAVDPVRAANDADKPHDNPEIAVDLGTPDELRWVDRALGVMSRRFLLRSIIVRIEYTASVSRAVKARMACDAFEKEMAKVLRVAPVERDADAPPALTVRQYRYELEKALDWFRGRLAA